MRYAILPALFLAACAAPSTSTVEHKSDPGALGPYSSGVQVGEMVLLSGKIGARDKDFAHEVTTCIDRIEANLAEFDLGLGQVVEARVYLVDMDRYAEFNKLYGERFQAPYPVRTCVAVAALPAGAQVEIQVAAHRYAGR
ncbi:MAG: 2-iminobutanoate/2-iminopropanoate deaminase [Planctomycetota bacterium]|jgi:2-iminobutanoate/2-iminopropanoate deaminase